MEALGARLRQLRKANGWTLADVAARTGLSVSFLSDIERGRTSPSLDTLEKLAGVYGLPMSQVLRVEEEPSKDAEPDPKGWRKFRELHPEIEPEMADLLRQVERRTDRRAETVEDWTRMYYSLLTLLGRQ